jgi:catechol 2,3-dioxygenase-like lactoylglutathione lyase family enzyme
LTADGQAPRIPALVLDHVQVAAPLGCEAEARRFYGELLGLAEIDKPASLASRGGAWFALGGGGQLHVGIADEFAPARKAHPAFRVDSGGLDVLARRLHAGGAPVTWDEELAGVRRFFTADPWGNRLELLATANPDGRPRIWCDVHAGHAKGAASATARLSLPLFAGRTTATAAQLAGRAPLQQGAATADFPARRRATR